MTDRRRIGLIGVLALSGFVLAGCGGGGDAPAPTKTISSATLSSGMTVSVTEDRSRVPVGGKVNLTTALTNSTDASITATYVTSAGIDSPLVILNVVNSSEQAIGTDGQSFIPPPGATHDDTVTLKPGESLTRTVQYTFTKADSYTVSAQVLSLSAQEPFTAPLTVKVGG